MNLEHRTHLTKKFVIFNLVLSLVLGLFGCASSEPREPQVLSEALWARLGTVGVTAVSTTPEAKLAVIPTGSMERAGKGAKSGATVGAAPGWFLMEGGAAVSPIIIPLGAVIAVVGAVVGAATGAVYGAVTAEPDEKFQKAEEIIGEAIVKLEVQKSLRDQILETARLKTQHQFIALPEDEYTEGNVETDRLITSDREIDALLETNVLSFGLVKQANTPSPQVAIYIQTSIRLMERNNSNVIYEAPFTYKSGFYDYSYWSEDQGTRLLEGLREGYRSLAEKIVEELFLQA